MDLLQQWRRLAAYTFVALGLAQSVPAAAAMLRFDPDTEEIAVVGEIEKGDARKLDALMQQHRSTITVTSSGGDVDEALAMGRVLRRREAVITAEGECFSACVFLYAGAVQRIGRDATRMAKIPSPVGIHRFFYASLPANRTVADITRERNETRQRIAQFLQDMNVSARVLEMMESIPPERMYKLTWGELASLGMGEWDLAKEEQNIARDANTLGISSVQLRTVRAACPFSIWDLDPVADRGAPSLKWYSIEPKCATRKFPELQFRISKPARAVAR
jgi:hypothetical protein